MKTEFGRPGKCLIDFGPMQMVLEGYSGKKPLTDELAEAADYAKDLISELSEWRKVASQSWPDLKITAQVPEVLKKMYEAVRATGDKTLTPMAAVAGAVADSVADFVVSMGATRVIVNNGGDIAIRLVKEETVNVGIVSDLVSGGLSHQFQIRGEDNIGGIATSGFGGRSFTKGAASAAVVLADKCALADAAATLVANDTVCRSDNIVRLPAEILDPETDIKGHEVTVQLGRMKRYEVERCLLNGKYRARKLYESTLIRGAVVYVQGEKIVIPAKYEERLILH